MRCVATTPRVVASQPRRVAVTFLEGARDCVVLESAPHPLAMDTPHLVALAAFAILIASVVCDLRFRIIPDTLPVALCALGLLAASCEWHEVTLPAMAIGLLLGFAIGAALFYLGAMGGGDAKLCAGLGAVCGTSRLLEVLFATALFGGVLSAWAKRRGMKSLPYAPAFAGGFLVTVAIAWMLPPNTGLWHLITGSTI